MAFIVMEHKETGSAPVKVDEAAFRAVWSGNGWTKVTKSTRKQVQAEAQGIADAEAEGYAEAEAEDDAERAQKKATAKKRAKAKTEARIKKDGKK